MLKICLLLALVAACLAEINYKDPSQPVEARVQALLAQMTLEERQAQVFSIHNKPTKEEYSMYEKTSIGAQKVSGFDENTPESLIAARNDEQRHFFENSRLGIPAAWHQETLNSAGPGATLFPLSIGLGATWNVSLVHDIGSVVARECRALGLDAAYSPEVNLYTDPRNGRGQEAFSEEPYLTGEMGVAMTLGIQGGTDGAPCGPQCYSAQDKVGAVGKHYVAYGAAQGGINAGVAALSEYTMRDVYVRPWRELVARAGLRAAMRSHEAWDALPLHANNYMAEVLNKELGFDLSWTISDCGDIELLRNFEFAWSEASAAALALNASVDVENQCGSTVYRHVIEAIQSGLVDEAMLNRSTARVLRHKFSLGLFDRPYVNATLYKSVLRAKSHLETSREAAKQSIVLLKNSGGVLPLSEGSLSRVALVGPNGGCAGDPSPKNARCDGNGGCEAQCSLIGKTFHPIGESVHVKTVEMIFNERRGTTVPFARGANINNMTDDASLVNAALAVAAQSDVVIAVLGDSMDSCSENSHLPKVDESGGGDRDSLDLPGTQETLLRALVQHKGATQKLIVVLVNGRAVTFGADNALLSGIDALLVAYRPGESGATAIYDVLTGAEEPTGRLSQSWPRNVGQVGGPSSPTLHQIVADWGDNTKQFTRGYFLSTAVPLFPFGFGLSYTTLDIKTASVSNTTTPLPRHPSQTPTAIAHVRVTVANVGTVRQGATVVQVYAHDPPYTGVVRYFRRLVAFAKTPMINPGDSVTLDIPITDRSLAYTSSRTTAFEHRLYPGDYQLWVSQAQIDASEIALKLTLSE